MSTYLLGIDVSTTATKALLIDDSGAVIAVAATEYPFETPQPLWTEQDAALFWDGTVQSVRAVLAKTGINPADIAGVGLSGQMHGLVTLDAAGQPLRPCILWNDQRTAAQCAEITARVGRERVLQLTGNPVLTGFTAPKVLWVQQNEPEIYGRIAHMLLPKDYARYKLTGEFYSEVSDASGTSLFDVGQRRWSDEMLAALDIPRGWLPEVTESPVASARISAEAAAATGLVAGTPVVGGGGDNAAAAVGTGIIAEGIISTSLGTSGVVFAQSDAYRVEPEGRLHAFCHAVPGKWHLMGVMLSAAGSFRWYRDALGQHEKELAARTGQDVYDVLTAEAAEAPAGCEGLLFLPYLTGERTPHPDPLARGLRRADRPPREVAYHPRRARRGQLRPARLAGADARAGCAGRPDPGVGRRRAQPALAANPGRRVRHGARHRERDRGRGLRRGAAGRRRRGGLPQRRGRVRPHRQDHGQHRTDRGRGHLRRLLPALPRALPGAGRGVRRAGAGGKGSRIRSGRLTMSRDI